MEYKLLTLVVILSMTLKGDTNAINWRLNDWQTKVHEKDFGNNL